MFLEVLIEGISYPLGIVIMFPWMGVILIIEVALIYTLQKRFRVANREIKRLSSVEDGKVLTLINESIVGTKIIRSFDKCKFKNLNFKKKLLRIFLFRLKEQQWAHRFYNMLSLIGCR
jgi:hypothetical protein